MPKNEKERKEIHVRGTLSKFQTQCVLGFKYPTAPRMRDGYVIMNQDEKRV
jgi:hypothetical protein